MDRKTSIAVGGSYAFTFLMKPYEKAMATWTPSPWVLNVASVVAVMAIAMLVIKSCWPNKKDSS